MHSFFSKWRWIVPVAIFSTFHAEAQVDSPIYKTYRPLVPSSLIRRSDVSTNVIQLFILERKAHAGDLEAQHELGLRYLLGEGVLADTAKGAFWIGRAAERGLTEAQFNMAILTFNGWGVEWNPFRTFELLTRSAEKMPEAQHLLGMFYTENLVVARDWNKAYLWVKRAADAGYQPSKEAVKDFEARGLGVPKDTSRKQEVTSSSQQTYTGKLTLGFVFQDTETDTAAHNDAAILHDALREATPQLRQALGFVTSPNNLEWDSTSLRVIESAAEEGSPEALTILGRNHERGVLVQKDPIKAALYYLRATRLSSNRAPGLLARLVQEETFLPHLKMQVERNDPNALYVYATLAGLRLDYLLSKTQFPITEEKGLELLQKAVESRHVQALVELGLCYYAGRWVKEDRAKAVELWNRAVAMGSNEAQLRIAALQVQSAQDEYSRLAAIAVLEKGVQNGSLLAQVALGYCYEKGIGVAQRWGEAAKLYRAAAQRGSKDAYAALQRMHDAIRPNDPRYVIPDVL
jgi:TPR repeat protein